jgi:hypothetical protein
VPVDFGTGSTTLELAAGDVPFQALEEITALPVELGAWVKLPYTGPLLPGGVENVSTLLADHLGTATPPALAQYRAVPSPRPTAAACRPRSPAAPAWTAASGCACWPPRPRWPKPCAAPATTPPPPAS